MSTRNGNVQIRIRRDTRTLLDVVKQHDHRSVDLDALDVIVREACKARDIDPDTILADQRPTRASA